MAEFFFFVAALGAVAGAVGTVTSTNPFYSVLSLVGHLLSLAGLFILLRAEFVGVAQVVVYVGAIMVLYVFVVAYIGDSEPPSVGGTELRGLSFLFAGALFLELSIAILGTGLSAFGDEGAGFFKDFGSPREMGELFLTKFLVAFEVASLLLLVAAVGAVILARRRSGLEAPEGTLSVADLLRSGNVGTDSTARPETMLEAGGHDPKGGVA
jgi:NADH:ubiquinone oxidoreductase subunit 6 (subunit J)